MKIAAKSVINGVNSLCEIAKEYEISKATLSRYVRKMRQAEPHELVRFAPYNAVRQIFTSTEEQLLSDYLMTASKLNHGLSTRNTRVLAFDFATAN